MNGTKRYNIDLVFLYERRSSPFTKSTRATLQQQVLARWRVGYCAFIVGCRPIGDTHGFGIPSKVFVSSFINILYVYAGIKRANNYNPLHNHRAVVNNVISPFNASLKRLYTDPRQ